MTSDGLAPKPPIYWSKFEKKSKPGSLGIPLMPVNAWLSERLLEQRLSLCLKKGRHNKSKDRFNEEHKDWDYAIEGKT